MASTTVRPASNSLLPVVGTELAGEVDVVGRNLRKHPRALLLGELDREMTDAAGSPVNKNRLASLQPSLVAVSCCRASRNLARQMPPTEWQATIDALLRQHPTRTL